MDEAGSRQLFRYLTRVLYKARDESIVRMKIRLNNTSLNSGCLKTEIPQIIGAKIWRRDFKT